MPSKGKTTGEQKVEEDNKEVVKKVEIEDTNFENKIGEKPSFTEKKGLFN